MSTSPTADICLTDPRLTVLIPNTVRLLYQNKVECGRYAVLREAETGSNRRGDIAHGEDQSIESVSLDCRYVIMQSMKRVVKASASAFSVVQPSWTTRL